MLTGFIYWVKVRFFIVIVAACFQVIAGGFVNNLGSFVKFKIYRSLFYQQEFSM